MMHKKLSIIIPVYNVRKYILQCLRSVREAIGNRDDMEVIVIDDGSPDDSMSVAASELSLMPYCIVFHQENKGLSEARNAGLAMAKGEYVWFVDSDDWILPDSVEYVLNNVFQHPDIEVFSSILLLYHDDTGSKEKEYSPNVGIINGKEYLKRDYRQGAVQRFVFKHDFLTKNSLKFYPGIVHEDSLFGFKMLYLASKICILEKNIYCYRLRISGSIMSSVSIQSAYDLIKIHKNLTEFMKTCVAAPDRQWYRLCIYHIIDCIFGFSRAILHTKEFKTFYKDNKSYIKSESEFLLRISGKKTYAIRMLLCPIFYMSIRYEGRLLYNMLRDFLNNK